jgi:multimeric flavodoxin WrbA
MKEKSDKTRMVLIVTHSRSGFTDKMANAIAEGVKEAPHVEAVIRRVNEVQLSDLAEADAIAIGSPIYLDYISGELKHLLDKTYYNFVKLVHSGKEKTNRLQGKPAAAFVSGIYKGYYLRKLQFRSTVLKNLENILFSFIGMRKVTKGIHLSLRGELWQTRASSGDPHAEAKDITMNAEQYQLCRNMGRKLALSTRVQS